MAEDGGSMLLGSIGITGILHFIRRMVFQQKVTENNVSATEPVSETLSSPLVRIPG
jgi:hypothetical protein